jgi:salicylate hydroxylase
MTLARRNILIAGGGISGLTAALALERLGFAATVFESAQSSGTAGAGIQLSPNATRILGRLGVLARLKPHAVEPKSVLLCNGATTLPLLSLDVSDAAERWGAPYLVTHRADLHAALLAQAASRPAIRVKHGCEVSHFAAHANGVTVSLTSDNLVSEDEGMLLIGADGVWSRIRARLGGPRPVFSGQVAHRKMFAADAGLPPALQRLLSQQQVAAFLSPKAHMVAYPVSGGKSLNLVAIAKGADARQGESPAGLPSAFEQFDPALASLVSNRDGWTPYPIHTVPARAKWSDGKSVVLIGDAAHAMTPYAAQGAAMAIEDAWVLAACLAKHRAGQAAALDEFQSVRRPRAERMARRSRLNQFAYHASGPAAAARNALFRYRSDSFRTGLDWIYAWDFGG